MKKYTLIKLYPQSPKLGTVVEEYENNGYEELEHPNTAYLKEDIENFPEFWQILNP